MGTDLNRTAYEKLIRENLEWLDNQPESLERSHVRLILEQSPGVEYEVRPTIARLQKIIAEQADQIRKGVGESRAELVQAGERIELLEISIENEERYLQMARRATEDQRNRARILEDRVASFKGELIEAGEQVDAERKRSEAAEWAPGAWACPECDFRMMKNVIDVSAGKIGASLDRSREVCPNDGKTMRPVSWKEYAHRALDGGERLAMDLSALRTDVKSVSDEIDPERGPSRDEMIKWKKSLSSAVGDS